MNTKRIKTQTSKTRNKGQGKNLKLIVYLEVLDKQRGGIPIPRERAYFFRLSYICITRSRSTLLYRTNVRTKEKEGSFCKEGTERYRSQLVLGDLIQRALKNGKFVISQNHNCSNLVPPNIVYLYSQYVAVCRLPQWYGQTPYLYLLPRLPRSPLTFPQSYIPFYYNYLSSAVYNCTTLVFHTLSKAS